MPAEVRERIVDTRMARETAGRKTTDQGKRIFFTDAVQLEISATEIRRAARRATV